jgi:hypothetical protein
MSSGFHILIESLAWVDLEVTISASANHDTSDRIDRKYGRFPAILNVKLASKVKMS